MRRNQVLALAVVAPLTLGGCIAAVAPMMMAGAVVSVGGFAKSVQLSTGGAVEISVDDTKLTPDQKSSLNNIRAIAVWPESSGGAVTFAEVLAEGGGFDVITPSRVSAALKKLSLPEALNQMTAQEARAAFLRVCEETGADALVSGRNTGGSTNMNLWSFERANITQTIVVSIYGKNTNKILAELPVHVKQNLGGKSASPIELSRAVNTEVARSVALLIRNPQGVAVQESKPQAVSGVEASVQPVSLKPEPVSTPPPSAKEIQQKLLTLGYQVGTPDGVMGKRTQAALLKFQQDNKLPATGKADTETMTALRAK